MKKLLHLFFALVLLPLTLSAQQEEVADSIYKKRQFIFALNNSFYFKNDRDGNYPNVKNYNQFFLSIMPKLGYFVGDNLALGLHYRQGRYWSNFGRSLPNIHSKGIFIEYYLSDIVERYNIVEKRTHKKRLLFNPYINASYNIQNYYMGVDSLNLKGAIFNGRNDNVQFTTLVGLNFNLRKKININVAIGIEYAVKPDNIIDKTRFLRTSPTSEIGIAYYLRKKIRNEKNIK